MNTAEKVANELLKKAETDAAKKLTLAHQNVQEMWDEALSIPSGCGGTPFRADARYYESLLANKVNDFRERFGQSALDKLHLFYGIGERTT
jgi:hypothetical protein